MQLRARAANLLRLQSRIEARVRISMCSRTGKHTRTQACRPTQPHVHTATQASPPTTAQPSAWLSARCQYIGNRGRERHAERMKRRHVTSSRSRREARVTVRLTPGQSG